VIAGVPFTAPRPVRALAALALAANLQKTVEKFRGRGLASSGGYLTHVGVGIILIGILASSGYDHGTKVTLERGKPAKVEDLTLTFIQSIPRIGHERERMEVAVETAGGASYIAYPRSSSTSARSSSW
jgi:cytochrome c-type biogenesis protein CcmF